MAAAASQRSHRRCVGDAASLSGTRSAVTRWPSAKVRATPAGRGRGRVAGGCVTDRRRSRERQGAFRAALARAAGGSSPSVSEAAESPRQNGGFSRLPAAGDAERERIEQDIHDGVQQQLTALRIRLTLAAETFHARGDTDAGAALTAFGEDVEQVIDDVRDLAHGIYPALLTSTGLGAAL